MNGHLQAEQPYLGDSLTWLLTTDKSWDGPPSRVLPRHPNTLWESVWVWNPQRSAFSLRRRQLLGVPNSLTHTGSGPHVRYDWSIGIELHPPLHNPFETSLPLRQDVARNPLSLFHLLADQLPKAGMERFDDLSFRGICGAVWSYPQVSISTF